MPPPLAGIDPDLTLLLALGAACVAGWTLIILRVGKRPDPERDQYADSDRPPTKRSSR